LLDHVSEFVGEQVSSPRGFGTILAFPENNLCTERVRARSEGGRGFRGSAVGVNAHFAEVVSKAILKENARMRL
jgi:hypothetical protein